jgi:hypothetical protein
MKILTQADIDEALFPFDRGSSFSEIARAVEAKILEKIKAQLLKDVCFKMAGGSPNRQRIHDLMETWK